MSASSQTYNDLGEPETESWSGGPLAGRSVTTSWDSFGRRQGVTTSVAGFQAQNVTTYDPAGRPAIITAGTHTATYRYVANSRLRAGVTYRANGTQRLDTQYDFDRLNRLQQVHNQPSGAGQPAERHAYTYNAAQQRIRDELADGSSWNWEYDRLGQVIGGRKSWPDGNPVAGEQFEYGFDDIGNRVSQKRGGDATGSNLRSTTYAVNPLNQITNRTVVGSRYLDLIGLAEPGTTVTANGVTATRRGEFWRAELNLGTGNPLWQSVNLTTSDGGSLANALYRVPPSSEVPTYDADGNLTADGLWAYTWDAENRLISMQSQALVPTAGRRKLDFEYDPLGRRIGRIVSTGASGSWVPTSTTRWLYEGWNPVAELNGAGTLVREYVWGTDLSGSWQGAGGVGGLLWVLEAPTGSNITAHYVAYDGNGNVMGLVNATDGTWSARYEYGPFGEVIRATGTMAAANPFRWSTKIQDEDSGLNYYGYRYYSPGVGRWLGRDPFGESESRNPFASADNSPVNFVDSDGRQLWMLPNGPLYNSLPPSEKPEPRQPHNFIESLIQHQLAGACPMADTFRAVGLGSEASGVSADMLRINYSDWFASRSSHTIAMNYFKVSLQQKSADICAGRSPAIRPFIVNDSIQLFPKPDTEHINLYNREWSLRLEKGESLPNSISQNQNPYQSLFGIGNYSYTISSFQSWRCCGKVTYLARVYVIDNMASLGALGRGTGLINKVSNSAVPFYVGRPRPQIRGAFYLKDSLDCP